MKKKTKTLFVSFVTKIESCNKDNQIQNCVKALKITLLHLKSIFGVKFFSILPKVSLLLLISSLPLCVLGQNYSIFTTGKNKEGAKNIVEMA